jgi:hypothetical protein
MVSWKICCAFTVLVSLDSQTLSTPFLLNSSFKISSFSCQIIDFKSFWGDFSPKRLTNPAFLSNLYTVEKSLPFSEKNTLYFGELKRKVLPMCKFWRIWAFFYSFFYDSPNNLPRWDLIKTHRGTSNNRKFDMQTIIS